MKLEEEGGAPAGDFPEMLKNQMKMVNSKMTNLWEFSEEDYED